MPYQVLARKWRPQRFDDVIGQQAVTRTLRNAIAAGRIAHAFVFAGSRGCGKTTTARILARALSCVKGPTADPCGECDACVEIAQGRDIDVLEIDAASHTGIDNIREVVIAGLSIAPVRNRYKVFIIDEVHQLSTASFNALLKSIEEPPAHVVFIMATTELQKIPDTILSRSQVFEFKTIPTKAIAGQLAKIAAAEGIKATEGALALVARAAEGSMRDAQSALDQVIAFAGEQMTDDDVATVLGLVGRDLLFDLVESVLDEDPPKAFALADRAVEGGHDLRLICRELSAVVRDLMMASVDPGRLSEFETSEGERTRLTALAARFSREDLMRAFDVLAKAEQDIRVASQPRYHFEMALLRWMHLRKLVPLSDLLEQLRGDGGVRLPGAATGSASRPAASRTGASIAAPPATARGEGGTSEGMPARSAVPSASPAPAASSVRSAPAGSSPGSARTPRPDAGPAPAARSQAQTKPTAASAAAVSSLSGTPLRDALLADVRSQKNTLYSLAIAMATRIDVSDERIAFTFAPNQKVARGQLEQNREWLENAAHRLAGRRIPVVVLQGEASESGATPVTSEAAPPAPPAAGDAGGDARSEAMASPGVRDLLDVFPGHIRDIEEI